MFWAVQGMAAELATGAIILSEVRSSTVPISMLVIRNEAEFLKKAKGKITFTCTDVPLVKNQFATYLQSETGTRFWMQSEGVDEQGEVVSRFRFEWLVFSILEYLTKTKQWQNLDLNMRNLSFKR